MTIFIYHYIRECIITQTFLSYMKVYIVLYERCIIKYLLLLYKRVYNDNKYFIIHESVFLIIQDDV